MAMPTELDGRAGRAPGPAGRGGGRGSAGPAAPSRLPCLGSGRPAGLAPPPVVVVVDMSAAFIC